MFYESHATYLELRGNFKKAEDIYTEGINRQAPLISWLSCWMIPSSLLPQC